MKKLWNIDSMIVSLGCRELNRDIVMLMVAVSQVSHNINITVVCLLNHRVGQRFHTHTHTQSN